jgi:hypothetical protein
MFRYFLKYLQNNNTIIILPLQREQCDQNQSITRSDAQKCPQLLGKQKFNLHLLGAWNLFITWDRLTLILLIWRIYWAPNSIPIYTDISNKMQRYTVYLYLETALHVSGGTFPHPQERIQLYLQHLVFVTIAADSSNCVTNTRCCRYSCMRSWWWVKVPTETCRAVSRYK